MTDHVSERRRSRRIVLPPVSAAIPAFPLAPLVVRVGIGLFALAAFHPSPVDAESTAEGTTVASVRAGSTCLKEQVRVTGFAMAREESGASLPMDGYRVTDILVVEGEKVAADQEILKAVRQGGDDAAAGRQAGPPTLSLRAPIAGRVTRINARVGMLSGAPSGTGLGGMAGGLQGPGLPPEPLIRIMGEGGIDLLVDVPSPYVTKLRIGSTARILREDGTELKANVRVPVTEVDPGTQLGRARLGIETGTALRPGQFASAIVETARDCGLAVPRSAVSYQNGTPTVQVLRGTTVETRSVRTGLFDESTIQIREGLSEGEPVVANAGTALRSGDKVTPVIADGANKGTGQH